MVCVVALVVPRQVQKRDRQGLRAAFHERSVNRLHRRVVFLRERLDAEVAGDGPRMLPEVEKVFPLSRRRQNAIRDAHDKRAECIPPRPDIRRNRNLAESGAPRRSATRLHHV